MIGGSLLFVSCLFAISISQHFYQVCFPLRQLKLDYTFVQIYLAQGIGLGTAIGIMYIPAVGIVSHYFQRRRALIIGIVTSVGNSLPLLSANV